MPITCNPSKKYYCCFFASCILLLTGCNMNVEMPEIKTITEDNLHGVIVPDEKHIWITGNFGAIFHSNDGGKSWEKQDAGGENFLISDGSFIDSKQGWLAGTRGTILHTNNSGKKWEKQNSGTTINLFDISFVDAQNGWAVGEWNTILHTQNGGKTWARQTDKMDTMLNSLFFIDRDYGWVIGERGLILHTKNGGKTWEVQLPSLFEREDDEDLLFNPPNSLFGIFFTDSKNGWICGIEGLILRTNDGGKTWQEQQSSTTNTLYTVFVKYGRGWIVGDRGTSIISEDGGSTWELQQDVIKSKWPFRDVFFTSAENGWAVGIAGSVIHSANGGQTWEFRSGISYAMDFFDMPKFLEWKSLPDFGPFAKE